MRGSEMKKVLLASVAGLAFLAAGNANAADLGARPMYKAPPAIAPAPVWSWTGLYFGSNIGSVWAKSRWDSTFEGDPTAEPEPVGVTYGGRVGYNWQFSNIVLGVEADSTTSGARD